MSTARDYRAMSAVDLWSLHPDADSEASREQFRRVQEEERLRIENASLARENALLRKAVEPHPDCEEWTHWDACEWNTIDEIVCRAHPKGSEAIPLFHEWWLANQKNWLGPHRACGAWLYQETVRARADATLLARAEDAEAKLRIARQGLADLSDSMRGSL